MFYLKPSTIRSAIIISLMSGLILFVIVSFGVFRLFILQENIEHFYSADYQHCYGVGFPITFEVCQDSLLQGFMMGLYRIIADILIWSAFASIIFIRPLLFIKKSSDELAMPEASVSQPGFNKNPIRVTLTNLSATFVAVLRQLWREKNIYTIACLTISIGIILSISGEKSVLWWLIFAYVGAMLPQVKYISGSITFVVLWTFLIAGTLALSYITLAGVIIFLGINPSIITVFLWSIGLPQLAVAGSRRSGLQLLLGIFWLAISFILPFMMGPFVSVLTSLAIIIPYLFFAKQNHD